MDFLPPAQYGCALGQEDDDDVEEVREVRVEHVTEFLEYDVDCVQHTQLFSHRDDATKINILHNTLHLTQQVFYKKQSIVYYCDTKENS